MKSCARATLVVAIATSTFALSAAAQPTPRRAPGLPPVTASESATGAPSPSNVRALVGAEYAAQLLRSPDPEERLRGIRRASAIGSAEAIALLVQAIESSPAVRADSRALIELARGLARFADQELVRTALVTIVNAAHAGSTSRSAQPARAPDATSTEEGDAALRIDLARNTAAIALGRWGGDRGLEQLYGIARGGGGGQAAAILALTLAPPRDAGFYGARATSMPPAVLQMLGQLGDLRALEILHAAARSSDVAVRAAALLALAELGDRRAIALARAAMSDPDTRLRAAAGGALVMLGAPERAKSVAALIADDATVQAGIRLADHMHDASITTSLAARARGHRDVDVRNAAIRALGRSTDPEAAKILASPDLATDGVYGYVAALALARSPAPNAMALLERLTAAKPTARLGVRAYVVRALGRGERSDAIDAAVRRLAATTDARDRSLGVLAQVALGISDVDAHLADADARVRGAAILGSLAHPSAKKHAAFLERLPHERDDKVRQLLAVGLIDGDDDGRVKTTWLEDRAESAGGDAALGAYALARRADESITRKVQMLLASKDPVLRAHAARGLSRARLADASGRLASAYLFETDVGVRRAVVEALAARVQDASAPSRKTTLETAAALDPDAATRQAARLGLAAADPRKGHALAAPLTTETAWLRLTTSSGAPPNEAFVGSLVRSDGVAVPIVFDDEGFAIVPGLPPGEARLVLAPRLPSYEAPSP